METENKPEQDAAASDTKRIVNGTDELFIELIENFFLMSGAIPGDYNVNDFNTEFVESVIEEQCILSVSCH